MLSSPATPATPWLSRTPVPLSDYGHGETHIDLELHPPPPPPPEDNLPPPPPSLPNISPASLKRAVTMPPAVAMQHRKASPSPLLKKRKMKRKGKTLRWMKKVGYMTGFEDYDVESKKMLSRGRGRKGEFKKVVLEDLDNDRKVGAIRRFVDSRKRLNYDSVGQNLVGGSTRKTTNGFSTNDETF